jgi:hypothetical protein
MPDFDIQIPGAVEAPAADDTPVDPKDARIAELETTVAQLNAALQDANEKLRAVQTVPSAAVQTNTGPRLIGENWAAKTSAEAQAAGVTRPVLCSDGYYVPA